RVDFPHPDSPTIPRVSPSSTVRLTSCTALSFSCLSKNLFLLTSNSFESPSTSKTALLFISLTILLCSPTGNKMIGSDLSQMNLFLASLTAIRTPLSKLAPWSLLIQFRRLSGNRDQLFLFSWNRDTLQESLRVRMFRRL